MKVCLVWRRGRDEWEQLAELAACPSLGDDVRFEIENVAVPNPPFPAGTKLAGTVGKVTHQSKRYSHATAIDVEIQLVDVAELEDA